MKRWIITACVLYSYATLASAQDYNPAANLPPMYTDYSTQSAAIMSLNTQISIDAQKDAERWSKSSSNDQQDQGQGSYRATNHTYTPSKSRTRTNLQNFANKSRAADPAGAAKMEQFFSSTDIIGQIGDAMQGKGLSASNAADVYAVWWVSAWQASRGDKSDVSAETYKVVAAQAARGLSSSSQFAQATDAQKQEMAEAMMIQAAMIDAHMESAAGNAEQLQAVAKAVAQGAKASGLDLNKMELTEKGFTSSDKTGDASDAAKGANPAAAPAAVAAVDGQGTPAKDAAPNYMLLAAIGTASLGGVFLLGKAMGKKG